MPKGSLEIDIQAPIDTVYAIVIDFPNYPELFPEVNRMDVEQQTKTKARVRFTVDIVKRIHYTLGFALKAPTRVQWDMIEGDFLRKNSGVWDLTATAKQSTHVVYTIELGFPPLVPAMVTQLLVNSTLPAMMKRLKAKAERLTKKGRA